MRAFARRCARSVFAAVARLASPLLGAVGVEARAFGYKSLHKMQLPALILIVFIPGII